MIPLRLVFRSRWAALAWAAGICFTALDFASDREGDVAKPTNGAEKTDNAAQAIGNGFDFLG